MAHVSQTDWQNGLRVINRLAECLALHELTGTMPRVDWQNTSACSSHLVTQVTISHLVTQAAPALQRVQHTIISHPVTQAAPALQRVQHTIRITIKEPCTARGRCGIHYVCLQLWVVSSCLATQLGVAPSAALTSQRRATRFTPMSAATTRINLQAHRDLSHLIRLA